jgi:Rieske Fe-S protein
VSENKPVTASSASRRALVGGVVGLGVGVPLVAACGSDESSDGGGSGDASTEKNDSGGGGGGNTGAAGAVGKTSEVPVGGAKIYKSEKVLVSQPSQGEFKAFSTVCTHRQCAITQLDGDEIECGCHHSRFKVADGSVVKGPATDPLPELKVTVSGDNLSVSS